MTRCAYNGLLRALQIVAGGPTKLARGGEAGLTFSSSVLGSGVALLSEWPVFDYSEDDRAEARKIYETLDVDEWVAKFDNSPPPFEGYVIKSRNQCAVVVAGMPILRFILNAPVADRPGRFHELVIRESVTFTDGDGSLDDQRDYFDAYAFTSDWSNHTGMRIKCADDRAKATRESFREVEAMQYALLMLLADDGNWVVEASPTKSKKPGKKSKFVKRLHERPRLLIWRKEKVNETFVEPVKARAGPKADETEDYVRTLAAHRRRGYHKTLRSPRFTHKRGKRVWVKATWVGPREMIVGHETYRVRLDL